MAMFTREALEAKTVIELRHMCVHTLSIPGMTKKRKDVIIDKILESNAATITPSTPAKETAAITAITSLTGNFVSNLTKPNAKSGDKTSTVIQVSCGAACGNFNVVGKSVGQVAEFLREVLNVDRMSRGIVNGKEVDDSYILKVVDILEYLKPAGRKG